MEFVTLEFGDALFIPWLIYLLQRKEGSGAREPIGVWAASQLHRYRSSGVPDWAPDASHKGTWMDLMPVIGCPHKDPSCKTPARHTVRCCQAQPNDAGSVI